MTTMRSVVVTMILAALVGCSRDAAQAPVESSSVSSATAEPTVPEPLQERPVPTAAPTAAATNTLAAVALPDMGSCVQQCAEHNQAKAVSPQQIDADCKATCRASCEAHCLGRGDALVDRCKKDCGDQIQSLRLR